MQGLDWKSNLSAPVGADPSPLLLGRVKQEDCKFGDSQSYRVNSQELGEKDLTVKGKRQV